MKFAKNLKKLKGDASSRVYFRKNSKNSSSIIVYAKEDKESNLLNYDSINRILIKNKILAPRLLKQHYSENYLEIQDFGNRTLFKILKNGSVDKIKIFKQIFKILNKLQLIKKKKIKNFRNKLYFIPKYTNRILEDEAKLFSEWYINAKLKKSERESFKKKYYKIIKDLIKKIRLKNDTFVHRDFHVSNLMMVKNKIGVIDSQDALIGNKVYDLASLIDDVRFETSEIFKKRIFSLYLKGHKKLNLNNFINDFEIISVLRNLKIIGIFTRLSERDNKKEYLKLIPYAWKLIGIRSKNNKKFNDLNNLIHVFKLKKR